MTVWLIEHGDYDSSVFGIASSEDKAVEMVRARYGPPYVVVWTRTEDGLRGSFEEVPNYSAKHTDHFTFTPYLLDEVDA